MFCRVRHNHRPTCDHHGRASRASGGIRAHHVAGGERVPEHTAGPARARARHGAVSSSRIQSSRQDLGAGVYACPQPHLYHLARLDEQYPRYADELLISGALEDSHPLPEEVRAILAPELPDSEGGTASEEPRQASLPDLLVTKAKQSGATVTIIEDAVLLESVGGVAAFLRWRG